jgi:hypothetical protein
MWDGRKTKPRENENGYIQMLGEPLSIETPQNESHDTLSTVADFQIDLSSTLTPQQNSHFSLDTARVGYIENGRWVKYPACPKLFCTSNSSPLTSSELKVHVPLSV